LGYFLRNGISTGIKPGWPPGLRFFGALSGKEQINPAIFIRFFSSFFLGFLTFFSDSEPSGTIFHYLNAVRTVGFFKKLSYPLCEYGSKKKITGNLRIGDEVL